MSVLIRGMEMPQKCGQCKLYHAEYPMYCMAVKGYRTVGAPYGMPRPDWCPMTEVKEPHGSLVDFDQMVEDYWDGALMVIDERKFKQIESSIIIEAEGSDMNEN